MNWVGVDWVGLSSLKKIKVLKKKGSSVCLDSQLSDTKSEPKTGAKYLS